MIALRASAPLDSSSDTERKSDFLLFFLSILCVMVGFRLCFFFVSLFRLTTICRGAIIGTPNIRCWCEIKTQRYTKVLWEIWYGAVFLLAIRKRIQILWN